MWKKRKATAYVITTYSYGKKLDRDDLDEITKDFGDILAEYEQKLVTTKVERSYG